MKHEEFENFKSTLLLLAMTSGDGDLMAAIQDTAEDAASWRTGISIKVQYEQLARTKKTLDEHFYEYYTTAYRKVNFRKPMRGKMFKYETTMLNDADACHISVTITPPPPLEDLKKSYEWNLAKSREKPKQSASRYFDPLKEQRRYKRLANKYLKAIIARQKYLNS